MFLPEYPTNKIKAQKILHISLVYFSVVPLLNVLVFFLISQQVFELLQYIHSCKSLHEGNLLH